MAIPQPLLDLVNSLQLVGVPPQAAPGDLISPRVVPDLSPGPGHLPNPTLEALTQAQTLAYIDTNLAPILNYIAATLGTDNSSVLKAVEFNKPVEARADQVDISSPTVSDLAHLVPRAVGTGNILEISQFVEGLIARSKGILNFEPGEFPSQVTALIRKPAILNRVPTVSLRFRVTNAAGVPLVAGRDYFTSMTTPFTPNFVLLPDIVEPSGNAPTTIRRNFFCDVKLTYTEPGATHIGMQVEIKRTLGPVSLDMATTRLPLIAILTKHTAGDNRFPGHALVAVPGNSNLASVGAAFSTLAQLKGVLNKVVTVLGLLGIGVPDNISAALWALDKVTGIGTARFSRDNTKLFVFVEFLPPSYDDWQYSFSAAFLFGHSSRLAYLAGDPGDPRDPRGSSGFMMKPSVLGVAAIPNLRVYPLAPNVGTATQVHPQLPAIPPGGSFNDAASSIHFPIT